MPSGDATDPRTSAAGTGPGAPATSPARETTVLVVPCFNESARLPVGALRAGLARDPSLSYVLVDDGSTDGTADRLAAVRQGLEGRVRVETLPQNAGKGEAVRHGMREAFRDGPVFVGYWDADLATPLEALEGMRRVLRGSPEVLLVMGARIQALGRRIRRRALRHYAGRIMATLISRTLRLEVYDTQCGAKVLRASPESEALFRDPFLTRWLFDVEILARIVRGHRAGTLGRPERLVVEHPLEEWTDVPGSKVRPTDFLRAVRDLRRIRRAYLAPAPGTAVP